MAMLLFSSKQEQEERRHLLSLANRFACSFCLFSLPLAGTDLIAVPFDAVIYQKAVSYAQMHR
jgi:hypothetical protein